VNRGECDAEVNLSKKNPDRWRPGFSAEPFCQSGDKRHEFLSRLKGYPDLVNATLTVNRQKRVNSVFYKSQKNTCGVAPPGSPSALYLLRRAGHHGYLSGKPGTAEYRAAAEHG
jgi:hypothetical protein